MSSDAGSAISSPVGRASTAASTLWAALASLILAVMYGRAGLLGLTQGVVGGHLDGYNNLWNYYWLKTALVDLHRNPFYTDYIYYPTGASLRFHTFNPFNGLVTMPFNETLGYIPTFNLIFVIAPFLTLLFTFFLIRDLTGNPIASFVGAAIATYADYHIPVFLSVGQSNMITLQFIPLYLFFLLRTLHGRPIWSATGGLVGRDIRRWPLYMILSILTLLGLTLTDWQYLMFAVFATLVYFVSLLLTLRSGREKALAFGKLSVIGGIYAAIVTPPLLLPMVKESTENPWLNVSHQAVEHSVDVSWLLSPGIGVHGLLIAVLALLGVWAALRAGRARTIGIFSVLVVAFFYLMSLGPVLIMGGEPTGIPMLYSLLQNLPVISSGRDPARFTLVATLGVGVLAAFGLRAILARMGRFSRLPAGALRGFVALSLLLALAVMLGGVFVESGKAQISPPDWPPFYNELAKDKESYAILELPLFSDAGRGADHYQMYQVLHHKLRFNGRLARDRKLDNPNNFVKRASLFRHLWMLEFPRSVVEQFRPERDILKRTDYRIHGVPILNFWDVRYIILYKEAISPEKWPATEEVVKEVLGSESTPYYDDRLMRVYKVPSASAPADPLTLDVGEGWSSSELDQRGVPFRWADTTVMTTKAGYTITPSAQLYTMNLGKEPVRATLNFTAFPYKQGRTLKVSINGYEAAAINLQPQDGARRISLDISLPSGNNLIEFTSPENPLPTDNPQADARLLSFAVQEVSLEATLETLAEELVWVCNHDTDSVHRGFK